MTFSRWVSITVLVCGSAIAAGRAGRAPLACNLHSLTQDERRRHATLSHALRAATGERGERPDGYLFQLDASKLSLPQLGEWITYEHRCCPFFHFRVDLSEDGALGLTLSGREGVKQFIASEFR